MEIRNKVRAYSKTSLEAAKASRLVFIEFITLLCSEKTVACISESGENVSVFVKATV